MRPQLNDDDPILSISKEELNELEAETISIPVEVITGDMEVEKLRQVCQELMQYEVLGFDTETKPVFQKGHHHPVSLLQLATPKRAFLFRLFTFEPRERLEPLQEVLGHSGILKVGVAIQDDCAELYQDYGLTTNCILDLRHLATADHMDALSLSKIYALLFGKRLTKGQRLTDWQQPELTTTQMEYAGLDAYAGLRIYDALQHLLKPEMINGRLAPPQEKAKKEKSRGKKAMKDKKK